MSKEELIRFLRRVAERAVGTPTLSSKWSVALEEPINIDRAARFIGLKKGTVYNMVCQRAIPHYKVGNRILFRESDLEAWFESKKVKTKQETDDEYVKHLAKKILAENVRR